LTLHYLTSAHNNFKFPVILSIKFASPGPIVPTVTVPTSTY